VALKKGVYKTKYLVRKRLLREAVREKGQGHTGRLANLTQSWVRDKRGIVWGRYWEGQE